MVRLTDSPSAEAKRVNFLLSERAYADLAALSKRTRRSMTELVRLGLGLAKLALEAEEKGNRLVITTADGNPLKELVLPG
jgi:hypothetical protein